MYSAAYRRAFSFVQFATVLIIALPVAFIVTWLTRCLSRASTNTLHFLFVSRHAHITVGSQLMVGSLYGGIVGLSVAFTLILIAGEKGEKGNGILLLGAGGVVLASFIIFFVSLAPIEGGWMAFFWGAVLSVVWSLIVVAVCVGGIYLAELVTSSDFEIVSVSVFLIALLHLLVICIASPILFGIAPAASVVVVSGIVGIASIGLTVVITSTKESDESKGARPKGVENW